MFILKYLFDHSMTSAFRQKITTFSGYIDLNSHKKGGIIHEKIIRLPDGSPIHYSRRSLSRPSSLPRHLQRQAGHPQRIQKKRQTPIERQTQKLQNQKRPSEKRPTRQKKPPVKTDDFFMLNKQREINKLQSNLSTFCI